MEKKFSFWPYIIVGMLSITGITNYLLVYYSSSVYSTPVSASPYNDSLKYNAKIAEFKCAKDKGYNFELIKSEAGAEIKVIGPMPAGLEARVEGWSGKEELLDEVINFSEGTSIAPIKTPLKKGLWNLEVSGLSKDEVGCSWRVELRGVL